MSGTPLVDVPEQISVTASATQASTAPAPHFPTRAPNRARGKSRATLVRVLIIGQTCSDRGLITQRMHPCCVPLFEEYPSRGYLVTYFQRSKCDFEDVQVLLCSCPKRPQELLQAESPQQKEGSQSSQP